MNDDMPEILKLLDAERPPLVVNFAAQSEVAPSWDHPEHWYQTNCVALAKLVNHLRRQDYLKRYLHVSSPEAYGTCVGRVTEDAPLVPSTPYAASKAAADMLLSVYHRQFGFPLLTVRATNVYGARQQLFKIIPRSVIYIKEGKKIQLHGGGKAVKSYIHIRDVSRGELAILEKGEIGRTLQPVAGRRRGGARRGGNDLRPPRQAVRGGRGGGGGASGAGRRLCHRLVGGPQALRLGAGREPARRAVRGHRLGGDELARDRRATVGVSAQGVSGVRDTIIVASRERKRPEMASAIAPRLRSLTLPARP